MKNIFLKSTFRQPIRVLCLGLLVAFVTFTFVGRVSEYLLIKQETERLEGYYRSVGQLEPLEERGAVNVEEAVVNLESSPYVQKVDRPRYTSAVMKDIYNADTDGTGQATMEFGHVFFYGTLVNKVQLTPGNYMFYFTVDSVVAGYPEYIAPGAQISMQNNIDDRLGHDYWRYEDLTEPFMEMEVGQRYFLRGSKNDLRRDKPEFRFTSLAEDGPWYIPVESGEEIDFTALEHADVAAAMKLQDDNMRALSVIATQDMSALPETQEASGNLYLTEGRWLTEEDNAQGQKVCVIREALAEQRGLRVGDTLDLTLRDITNGEYSYGCLYLEEDLSRWGNIETAAETYEIVGIYNAVNASASTYYSRIAYIPASAVPESFAYARLSDKVIFELTSPAEEHAFLAESEGNLAKLGFRLVLVENGFADFQAAAKPMAQSASFNALVYVAVYLTALGLVEFLYFFMRRKEMAITRALGLPIKRCAKQSALPLLLIGVTGILTGSVLGWRYTLNHAAEPLEVLAAFGANGGIGLSSLWLILLCGAVLLLFAALTVAIAFMLVKRPILSQMQGQVQKKVRKKVQKTTPIQEESPQTLHAWDMGSALAAPLPAAKTNGVAFMFRFVLRHILRAPIKSLLVMGLAVVFTVGLAVMQVAITTSEEKLESLYENTQVALDIVRIDTEAYIRTQAFLRETTVQDLLDTGFISSAYLEGYGEGAVLPHAEVVEGDQAQFINGATKSMTYRSLEDWEAFTSGIGSGADVTATFFDGWDESLFAQDWSQTDLPPVVISKSLADFYNLGAGDTIGAVCSSSYQVCQVAGIYEGVVTGADRGFPVLLPESVMESILHRGVTYIRAHFILDPARNREIADFRTMLEEIVNAPDAGTAPLRAVLQDEELRQAVEPLEDSIALMKLLYPVVVVLSVLVAAGVSVLLVLLAAKEAAILRVQGTTKARTVLILSLQQVFTCFVGLLIGLIGILVYLVGTKPELLVVITPGAVMCVVLYLTAGIVGAVISSVGIVRKNPLEMLQVKE